MIKNKALGFLAALKDEEVTQQLLHRFREASNMTDKTAALACLCDSPGGLLCGIRQSEYPACLMVLGITTPCAQAWSMGR